MIRRLVAATHLVLLVQARGYFPHAFALYVAMVVGMLLFLVPEQAARLILPVFLVSEPGMLGVTAVAAHRYLELGNASASALQVSPLRPGEHLLALQLASALLATIAGVVTFAAVEGLDARLAGQRYLCGNAITEADWRLFATLVRFDVAYYGQFRCNRNRLAEFEQLWPYTRDLYQQPGVAPTVDVDAIKGIYYGSRPPRILPKGPRIDFAEPHDRARLSA